MNLNKSIIACISVFYNILVNEENTLSTVGGCTIPIPIPSARIYKMTAYFTVIRLSGRECQSSWQKYSKQLDDMKHNGPNGSCLFAARKPTDTVDGHNFRTFSTRHIAFLVAERPMPALLLRHLLQCAGDIEMNPGPV